MVFACQVMCWTDLRTVYIDTACVSFCYSHCHLGPRKKNKYWHECDGPQNLDHILCPQLSKSSFFFRGINLFIYCDHSIKNNLNLWFSWDTLHRIDCITYIIGSMHHRPQYTQQIENMTRLSPRNGRHLWVNADLYYEPRREGQWTRGREGVQLLVGGKVLRRLKEGGPGEGLNWKT